MLRMRVFHVERAIDWIGEDTVEDPCIGWLAVDGGISGMG